MPGLVQSTSSTGVIGNAYTSQLNVTVSPEMKNRTVECAYDDGVNETTVGVSTCILTTGVHFHT